MINPRSWANAAYLVEQKADSWANACYERPLTGGIPIPLTALDALRVPPRALVPEHLKLRPFSLADAAAAGLTRWQLEGASWRKVGRGIYVWKGAGERAEDRLMAISVPPGGDFAGRTAAWLNGLDTSPCDPIELIVPNGSGAGSRLGVSVRRIDLPPADIVIRRGFPATSLPRTIADLLPSLGLVESVVFSDMALNRGLMELTDLTEWSLNNPRRKGVVGLRRIIDLTDGGAESPMETRLRLRLVVAGLPRPQTQATLYDSGGTRLARVDLYYPEQRLVIEYDGQGHRDTLNEDIRRQNLLLAVGYRLLRFTAADLAHPERVIAMVRHALGR